MTQTHTPGPWIWRVEDGPQWFLDPGILIIEGGMTDGTPDGDEIDRANARLIAAAPDLLEALKEALDAWDTHNKHGDGMQGHWASDARAAIAKAKGGDA